MYILLGQNYEQLGDYDKAEEQYTFAMNQIPNLFYPHYMLIKLYYKTHKYGKLKVLANKLLTMKVKVKSQAVDEMKEEVEHIVNELRMQ